MPFSPLLTTPLPCFKDVYHLFCHMVLTSSVSLVQLFSICVYSIKNLQLELVCPKIHTFHCCLTCKNKLNLFTESCLYKLLVFISIYSITDLHIICQMRLTEHSWGSLLNLPSPPKLIRGSVLLNQLLRTVPHT